ncbi:hypothetical protein [Acinetobacter bereziniae]|uniref:hypothetical protein n=1 Tax=Acinetobacter bereziniae TaxID=106648 RepID=UPI0030177A3B
MNNSKFQYWFFIIFTIIYFLVLNRFFDVSFDKIKTLHPNELGDFLAGTFSPLAFLFLILGYLQTNKSLGQNTEAISQQAIALQQQAESLKQQAKALDTQIAELQLSNESYQRQVEEMEKSVQTQQNMFDLAEKQYKDSINEKVKNNTPVLSLVASKYLNIRNPGSTEGNHRFSLIVKANNKPIRNLIIRSNFWNIAKQGGSYDLSKVTEINSIEINKPVTLQFYIITNTVPFQKNILNFDYYDEDGTKYSKKYELNKNEDEVVMLQEIPLNS